MSDLIFHLGLTKTGSSFLQRKVFGGKVNTLERAISWSDDAVIAEKLQEIFLNEPVNFWSSENGKIFFGRNIVSGAGNIIVSHESLFKHIPYVDSEEEIMREPALLAEKLKAINENCWPHGQVKVLFFFRRQDDWLASMYAHVTYAIKKASQEDFENRVKEIISYKTQKGRILKYDEIYKNLADALGEHNVLPLPYERFSNREVWDKIEGFTGALGLYEKIPFNDTSVNTKQDKSKGRWSPSGKRLTFFGININRMTKFFIRKVFSDAMAKKIETSLRPGWRLEISEELRGEILKHYEDSNRRMSEICRYELSEDGYY